MTAPITAYTHTDAVRACMGVTDNEMSDEMLLDMGLSIAVISDLEAFLPNHEDVWNSSKAQNATANQILAGRYIELFCSYDGANRAMDALLAIPQEISDGKARISRFSIKEQLLAAQERVNQELLNTDQRL